MAVSTSLGIITSAAVTEPGGTINVNGSGTTVTWTQEGNADGVIVVELPNTTTYDSGYSYSDINSPFTVPSAAYPASGGVSYNLYSIVANETVSFTGPNLGAGSSFEAEYEKAVTITK